MKATSAALLGILLNLPYEGTETPPALLARTDVSAILRTWRIKGVMACHRHGRARVCLRVENAYPCGVFEVVRKPYASHFPFPLPRGPGGLGSSAGSDRGQTNLQFGDARVFTFIPPLPEELPIPIAHPRGPFFQPNYVSELDAWSWRTGLLDRVLRARESLARCDAVPDPALCAGRWGPYYPRQGFLVHQSEPMASLLLALRAGRAANDPAGRFVLARYPFEPRTGHLIQMVRPVHRPAMRIGQPGPVDEGAGSREGAYLYIHYGIFEECRGCLAPRLVGVR